jgi:hypothetical protein
MSEGKTIPFNSVMLCPHCDGKTQFDLIFPSISKGIRSATEKALDELLEIGTFQDQQNVVHRYFIWRCLVCNGLLFVAKFQRWNDWPDEGVYPSHYRSESKFRGIVPETILEDFEEAVRCYEIKAFRATAAMCRRSLQCSVTEQGAPKGKLQDQIDALHASSPDRITTAIKDWAHNIRIFGNWGAHPDDDGLKEVDEGIASEVIDFLTNFFQYVYVMPSKVAKAQAKRDSTKDK